jgi:hypothetical protein
VRPLLDEGGSGGLERWLSHNLACGAAQSCKLQHAQIG